MRAPAVDEHAAVAARPRLGFLGVGWIGRNRLDAIAASGAVEVVGIADAVRPTAEEAAGALGAIAGSSLDELLALGLDGVVVATPSALHAEQARAALEGGVAVFCQKPLARTAAEARSVVAAAREADRLLAVDFSYRFVAGVLELRELVRSGALGEVYAADLVFHNAYGPDKAWFREPRLSGGGCVIDLGTHLIDLSLWTLGFPGVSEVRSHLFHAGRPFPDDALAEDYAVATLELETGAAVRLACSWWLSAGRDCVIEASFYGTRGAAALRNVAGSFYDFRVERYAGRSVEVLSEPPDDWGGRAIVDWARRLGAGETFDPACEEAVAVADIVDRIYGRASP